MADAKRHGTVLHLRRGDGISIEQDGKELARLQYQGLKDSRRGTRAEVAFEAAAGIVARPVARSAMEGFDARQAAQKSDDASRAAPDSLDGAAERLSHSLGLKALEEIKLRSEGSLPPQTVVAVGEVAEDEP